MKPKFYEFFAGGGMARAGLEPEWKCLFANDVNPLKGEIYTQNWGKREFRLQDIGKLSHQNLPGKADLAWASFPCQDLSIAGLGAGLDGTRSSVFWAYCRLLRQLASTHKLPCVLVLENVTGTLSSKGGRDFQAICAFLRGLDYSFGAVIVDAAHFVPQSRPRLFIVAVRKPRHRLKELMSDTPTSWCTTELLCRTHGRLPTEIKENWCWWQLPTPPIRKVKLADVITATPCDANWHTRSETARLLKLMMPTHLEKIAGMKKKGTRIIGTIYRRMREVDDGSMRQRAEVRFDDLAGCLRTAAGGSSRQIIVDIDSTKVRTRLLSRVEGARLMGLPRSYKLPSNYYEAFQVLGDGLAVPLVRFLSSCILLPLVEA